MHFVTRLEKLPKKICLTNNEAKNKHNQSLDESGEGGLQPHPPAALRCKRAALSMAKGSMLVM